MHCLPLAYEFTSAVIILSDIDSAPSRVSSSFLHFEVAGVSILPLELSCAMLITLNRLFRDG